MISLYFSYALGIPLNYSLIYRSQNMVSGQMLTFKIKFIYLFYLFAFFPNILTILFIHSSMYGEVTSRNHLVHVLYVTICSHR